jgi:hypothetical protein
MNTFWAWLESLGWQAALCFTIGLGVFLCVLILLIDIGIRRYAENAELRAIRERVWNEKKARLAQSMEAQREREAREADDAEFLRRLEIDVKRDDLQSRREARQFHLPAAFRDFKGITKL